MMIEFIRDSESFSGDDDEHSQEVGNVSIFENVYTILYSHGTFCPM